MRRSILSTVQKCFWFIFTAKFTFELVSDPDEFIQKLLLNPDLKELVLPNQTALLKNMANEHTEVRTFVTNLIPNYIPNFKPETVHWTVKPQVACPICKVLC